MIEKKYCRNCNKEIFDRNITGFCLSCFNIITKTKPKTYCIDCHKELRSRKSKRCWSCASILRMKGKSQKGKDNPNYIDGRTKQTIYPLEFLQKKDSIRKRDNYTCQNPECGMTEEEHLIVYGSCLEIHHIDYIVNHNEDSNLLTLCKQCNVRANYNRTYWQTLFSSIIKSIMEKIL